MTNPRPVAATLDCDGSERRVSPWYRQAKATKCGERGGRKSEYLIVPWKQGNSGRGDPVEERRCRVMDPLKGNTKDTSKSAPCQRHVNG